MNNKDIEEHLKKEMEGNLYAEISLTYTGRDFVVRKDIYTVINGKVASISKDRDTFFTGDTLFDLNRECHLIGKYGDLNQEFFKSQTYTYSKIVDLLGVS